MSSDVVASVIVPCFRAVGLVDLQLEALSRQVAAPVFEVLLIDNGENAGLSDLAREYAQSFRSLRVVSATERRGAGYARNVGIWAAQADYLLFCDADDVVAPSFVSRGVELLHDVPVYSGGASEVLETVFAQGLEAVWSALEPIPDRSFPLRSSGTSEYPILMGGSFGIRAEVAKELQGFDLSFGSAAEDNDFAFRLVKAGYELPDASHITIAYRKRVGSASFRRGYQAGRAHARLCARHGAWGNSNAYRGRWMLRPARLVARILLGRGEPGWPESLGAQIGVVAGWVMYRSGRGLEEPDFQCCVADESLSCRSL